MPDVHQLALLCEGVEAWNAWRTRNPETPIDLSEAVLIGQDLRLAELANANLDGAHLGGAYLDRAVLAGATLRKTRLFRIHMGSANLKGADLEGADLGGAHLCDSDFEGANLRGTMLRGANFFGTRLMKADFQKAQVGRTVFGNVDLSKARGLASVKHAEPSTIGIDTFLQSEGKIPAAFLLGAGIPKAVVEGMASFVGKISAKK